MRIGIIGPSKIDIFCKSIELDGKKYLIKINELANILSKFEYDIIIVPQKKSSPLFFAEEFKNISNNKILGIIPLDDTEFGIDYIEEFFCDEIINCGTWRNQPETMCENCDILVCIGFSAGTLIELMYTKYFKVKKLIVIEDFITSKLPIEINNDINIEYVKLDEVEKIL